MKTLTKSRKLSLIVCISLTIQLLQSYCFADPLASAAEPIKIGALLDLSGEYAAPSEAFREGIQLAVEEVNQAGGVSGRPIKIVFEDTQYRMPNVQTASKKLLDLDRVSAAVVGTYTEAMVAGSTFESAKVPLLCIWDSAPELEAIGDYVFGMGVWSPSTGGKAQSFSRNNLKANTAVTVSSNGEWSLSVAKTFREEFTAAGGKILGSWEVNPDDTDFRTLITKIKHINPDVLYAPVSDNISAFWKQLDQLSFKKPAITSDVLTDEMIALIGPGAEGVYQTLPADPESGATSTFLAAYEKKFGKKCNKVFLTALGYDSIKLLAKAMSGEKNPSNEQIKKELYAIADFPGAAGVTSFDENGSARKLVDIFRVREGSLVPLEGS